MTGTTTTCPKCEKRLRVAPEHVGLRVRCSGCQTAFDVLSVKLGGSADVSQSATPTLSPDDTDAAQPVVGVPVSSDTAASSSKTIGRFQLSKRLGQGAFGVVYLADDPELSRRVALKVPRFSADDQSRMKRFAAEARAAASLRHPHIVAVYDAGKAGRQPYIAYEYIDGETLSARLKRSPPDLPTLVGWIRKLADAMAYAHDEGIIHRDLKPDNIILDGKDQPQILDFGLAKQIDDDSSMTVEGSLLGTPIYMSPEQARGDTAQVGPQSDQYSLGAIFYELLTGQKPFDGPQHVVIDQVIHHDPPHPARLKPKLPHELVAICLMAMEKDPARRYASCAEFGDDLANWTEGRPILAKRPTAIDRATKWIKRNRTIASLMTAVVVVLMAGLATSLYFAVEAARRASTEAAALVEAKKQTAEAKKQRVLADQEKNRAEQQRKLAESETARAEKQRELAETEKAKVENQLYASNIDRAKTALDQKNLPQVLTYLAQCPVSLHGWEHHYLRRQVDQSEQTLQGFAGGMSCVCVSPDGKKIISGGLDSRITIRDAATGSELLTFRGHGLGLGVTCIHVSPDGRRVVTGDGNKVRVWDATKGRELLKFEGHTYLVESVFVSPDGSRVVSGGQDNLVKVWDINTGQVYLTLTGHNGIVSSVSMSPDGQQIISGSWDKSLRVWDAVTGKHIRSMTVQVPQGKIANIACLCVSSDSKRIVSGSFDGTIKVWDAATGRELHTLSEHSSTVVSVCISLDGERIISGSADKSIKVWDALSGRELHTLVGHTGIVKCVCLSPDAKRIFSASPDGSVKIWIADPQEVTQPFEAHPPSVTSLFMRTSVFMGADDRQIISAGSDSKVKFWDATTGQLVHTLYEDSSATAVCMDGNGTRIIVGDKMKSVTVWDCATRKKTLTLVGHDQPITCVDMSPNGQRIISGSRDGVVKVWDVATGRALHTLRMGTGGYWYSGMVHFCPDSQRIINLRSEIVEGQVDYSAEVWDVASGEKLLRLDMHPTGTSDLCLSPDGRTIATASSDNTVKIWDAATFSHVKSFVGHTDDVHTVCFSPDGRRVVTAGKDKTVRVWNAETGQEVLSLAGHAGGISSVCMSRNGERIISGDEKGVIRIWDSGLH